MEPRLSLALSVHSNPGIYSLLLGSGVSRAAGIPTGWEVVLDLVRRVAAMEEAEIADDPFDWYRERFDETPDYSLLLDRLAPKPDERQRLLRSYFEPTEEERQQGLKQPTEAHHAIANLCRGGYLRLIVTTNFDRLLEQALGAEGLEPTVVSTSDAVRGAPPLTHADLLIVKLHGDYLDTRIRNTSGELDSYPEPLADLLDRVLREFGLVVCGWSAEWDPALRGALERCENLRYTTYWTGLEEPGERLSELLRLRRAEFIPIESADQFFGDLNQRVLALEKYARPHPLSVVTAVAMAKRYLPNERHDIRLHDLVADETENIFSHLTEEHFPANESFSEDRLLERVRQCDAVSEILRGVIAVGCYWGEERHERTWTRCIERLAKPPEETSYKPVWQNLRRFPGTLVLYTGGAAALAAERWGNLRALLLDPRVTDRNRGVNAQPALLRLQKWASMELEDGRRLPDMERRTTPVSDWIHKAIRPSLRPLIPDQERYDELFDLFEYFLALVHADFREDRRWGPVGRFRWRTVYPDPGPRAILAEAAESAGESWPPLRAGFFGGSLERFTEVRQSFDEFMARAS